MNLYRFPFEPLPAPGFLVQECGVLKHAMTAINVVFRHCRPVRFVVTNDGGDRPAHTMYDYITLGQPKSQPNCNKNLGDRSVKVVRVDLIIHNSDNTQKCTIRDKCTQVVYNSFSTYIH